MKIAFARFGLAIELNLSSGSISTLGTEIRSGLLHDWVEQGHEVNIVSEIKRLDKALINQISFGDNWYNELKNNPDDLEKSDMLFIECGAANTLYSGKEGGYVENVLKLMSRFDGPIIYYQHGHLPFPFNNFKETDNKETVKELADNNIRKMFVKCFGKKENLLSKDITILHHFQNYEGFIEEFNYTKYKNHLKFISMPIGYSDNDPKLDPKEKPEYDLIWIGGEMDSNKCGGTKENTRAPMLEKFFVDTNYKSAVIGRWSDETKDKVKANFLGALGYHGDAYNFFNNSYCTFWGGSKSTARLGLLPTRPVMALRSGSIVIAQFDMYGAEDYILKEFLVSNKEEIEIAIEKVRALDADTRKELCEKQLKNFVNWKDVDWREKLEL